MRALLLGLALLAAALAPLADAEQACVWNHGSHCDDHLACYYNRLTMQWDCHVEIHDACEPTTCDPA